MNYNSRLTFPDRALSKDAHAGEPMARQARPDKPEISNNVWTRRIVSKASRACGGSAMIGESADTGVKLAMELVDLDTLRQLEEDTSKELLPQMVAVFCEETLDRVRRVRQAMQSSDFVALASEAHAIKSGAGTFGARELQALARIVEQASRDGDYEIALSKAAELQQVASLSLDMLTQYAESGKDVR